MMPVKDDIIRRGELRVPLDCPPGVLHHMERLYRHVLWPPVASGYVRYTRQFAWEDDGRTLKFVIVDVPGRRV